MFFTETRTHDCEGITLATIKATPALAEMDLLRLSRLSVSAVRAAEWELILEMAGGAG